MLVAVGGGDDRDVHASHCVYVVVADFGEDELLGDAEGVVAVTVKRLGRQTSEVADAGNGEVHKPVEELPHALAPKGCFHSDGVAFSEAEVGDGLLGFGDYRPLPGDSLHVGLRAFQKLGLLGG